MADRRRRRQINTSEEILSEGESQQASNINLSVSEHDSDEEYVDMSEFDSAEDDDDDCYEESAKEDEEENADSNAVEENEADETEAKTTAEKENVLSRDEQSDDVQRESGDGKSDNDLEKPTNRVLKISQQEESPFFIPTKGNFFQHDMRSEDARGRGRPGNRNFSRDSSKSKWVHDRYDENEQAPKSREEIVAEYGYDIRARKYNDQSQSSKTRSQHGRRPGGRRGLPRQQYKQTNRYARNENTDVPETDNRGPPPSNRGRRDRTSIRSQNFRATRRGPTRSEHDFFEGDERNKTVDANPKKDGKRQSYNSEKKDPERNNSPPPPKPTPKDESPSGRQVQQQANTPDLMEDVLDVINNREQGKPQRNPAREKGYSSKRRSKKNETNLTERIKEMSLSGPKETSQPRRYSSLRQRATESPNNPPRRFPQIPNEWNQGTNVDQSRAGDQTSVQEVANVEHLQQEPDVRTTQIENNLDFSRISNHQAPAYDMQSSGVNQEMADSMFANSMQPMLNQAKPDTAVDMNDPQRWIDSAIAYQESLIAQSRALMLSAALQQQQQQQPLPGQLPAPNLLLNNEPEVSAAPQAPPISHPSNQRDIGALGSLVFPPPIPQNFPPNNFVQRNVLPERPVLPPNMQIQFPPGGLIGQQVGGVTYYPNPLQPVQNVVPVNTPVGSPMRRINAAIPIRQPMQ